MAFAHRYSLTIDHTKCGGADATNFPLYVAGAAAFATVANGGYAQNSSGFDVCFFYDAACTARMDWQRVDWSAATGLGEWHIRIPTLSHSADTVIYIGVGDPSITTDQSNKTGVWDSTFLQVSHFGTPTSLSVVDSTSHAASTANVGVTAGTGKLGGAANYASATNTYLQTTSGVAGSNARWISMWGKGGGSAAVLYDQWDGVNTPGSRLLVIADTPSNMYVATNGGEGRFPVGILDTTTPGITSPSAIPPALAPTTSFSIWTPSPWAGQAATTPASPTSSPTAISAATPMGKV